MLYALHEIHKYINCSHSQSEMSIIRPVHRLHHWAQLCFLCLIYLHTKHYLYYILPDRLWNVARCQRRPEGKRSSFFCRSIWNAVVPSNESHIWYNALNIRFTNGRNIHNKPWLSYIGHRLWHRTKRLSTIEFEEAQTGPEFVVDLVSKWRYYKMRLQAQ